MLSVIGLNCMEAAYNRTKPNKRLFMSEIRYMQTEAVDKGSLKVEVVTGRMRRPIEGAQIAISYSGDPDSRVEEVKADASGMSEELVLDAPPLEYSMEPSENQPFSQYTVKVTAPGYRPVSVSGVQIFSEQLALQQVQMSAEEESQSQVDNIVIPVNTLSGDFPPKIAESEIKPVTESGEIVLSKVVIPEFVYVRDIYENGNARANTMFKLTYQAFILFGICMSYIITRFLLWKKERILQVFGGIGLVLLLWTFGYFGTSVYSWFGNVFDLSEYRGLDATAYLENVFSEDAGAIRWLDETIEGQSVVLEANGDSYSDYERVSAMTGLPTVLGWYVHEWLWRGDPADLNVRAEDVKQMYTSTDTNEVLRLLEQYHVTYIFVGSKEKEKYGDALNESLLQSIGDIVYQDTASGTHILQVQDT